MVSVYHVTERAAATAILRDGFVGGWGDLGHGVYFYGNLVSAEAYACRGGWDGDLTDPVIMVVADSSVAKIDPSDLDPSWNADDYADMYWRAMNEDGDTHWMPGEMAIVDAGPFKRSRRKH